MAARIKQFYHWHLCRQKGVSYPWLLLVTSVTTMTSPTQSGLDIRGIKHRMLKIKCTRVRVQQGRQWGTGRGTLGLNEPRIKRDSKYWMRAEITANKAQKKRGKSGRSMAVTAALGGKKIKWKYREYLDMKDLKPTQMNTHCTTDLSHSKPVMPRD